MNESENPEVWSSIIRDRKKDEERKVRSNKIIRID